jgi:hypothetical protein
VINALLVLVQLSAQDVLKGKSYKEVFANLHASTDSTMIIKLALNALQDVQHVRANQFA